MAGFYLLFSLVLDLAGAALIAGLSFMMYRRGWMRLPKLDYARPDRLPETRTSTGPGIGARTGPSCGYC